LNALWAFLSFAAQMGMATVATMMEMSNAFAILDG
jgi:hypothetical protein